MVEKPIVWVVVLNWNGWGDTITCLESLRAVKDPPASVIVVDNGSTDESIEKLATYRASTRRQGEAGGMQPAAGRFELLKSKQNLGFGGGMNFGIKHALDQGAQWVLLLNNDTTVDPAFLEILLSASKTDPRIGLLNPKILLQKPAGSDSQRIWFAGSRLNLLRTRGIHIGYGEVDRGQYDDPPVRNTAFATGGCLLVRRKLIDEIGLISESFFMYYEDVEWSLRARHRGWRSVVVPAAAIWHKGAASSKEHSETYIRYHVRNGLMLARRTGNAPQLTLAYVMSIIRAVWQLPKLLRGPRHRLWAKAVLWGIADAWLGKTGRI